jgi:hypothetical protein
MSFKAARCAVLLAGLLGAIVASADGGRPTEQASFDSYFQAKHEGGWRADNDHDNGGNWYGGRSWTHVKGVPEPSEWLYMGIGLVLIGAVAYRRKAKLLSK